MKALMADVAFVGAEKLLKIYITWTAESINQSINQSINRLFNTLGWQKRSPIYKRVLRT